MLNKVLAGRFKITAELGAGGMGQVWAAEDERMRRDVAVKVVHPQYGMAEAETQARFQREVQLAGRLSHQNIVTVHDWGEVSVDGRPTLFLVMELVRGVPLHRRLKESTPSWPLAVGWAAQIAEALHAAHGQGVVHRDIKPANALLTPGGTVKVLDFGVAKFMGETIGARELTVTGTPVGSPSYMSPEQADGDKTIDHRSDLYSLGCLLYHAVTGRPPFTGTSQWAVLRKQMQDTPEPPASRVEGLPAPLNDLILNLLAKRPWDRPADAAAVYEALSILLADHAVTEPGGTILDITQLGHSHSVSGRILKRAWELFQWTEWNLATRNEEAEAARADAEQILRRARTEAERLLDAASTQAQEAIADSANEARIRTAKEHVARLVAEAVKEAEATKVDAEQIVADARAEAEKIVAEAAEKARTSTAEESAMQLSKAAKVAEDVLNRATEEAQNTTKAAERIRHEAETEADRLRAEAASDATESRAEGEAEAVRLRAEAKELVAEANSESGKVRIAAVKRAEGILKDAEQKRSAGLREAEQLRAYAVAEGEKIRAEARKEAVQQIEEAAKTAEDLLGEAKTDADEMRQAATTWGETVRREAIERATTLRRQAEETLERTRKEARKEAEQYLAERRGEQAEGA